MTTEDGSGLLHCSVHTDSARLSATMQKPIHLQHAAYANTLGIQDNEVQTETGEGGYDYKAPRSTSHLDTSTISISQDQSVAYTSVLASPSVLLSYSPVAVYIVDSTAQPSRAFFHAYNRPTKR
ncbi:hypothetical protein FPV67DRAFT_1671084 [Lyophyllum atratum]|nr:hypothetical protein FPV67DRAFT_1671084 [Lyophyllum atratum]